ncbi:DUF6221 family protein [Nonomuraea sp. NPDC050790]|uniref:DUF6221 family protein n=1 Tax=Nonomuraea sp. NPDC050790 TaxID=3364371 RepID=UPI0037AF0A08
MVSDGMLEWLRASIMGDKAAAEAAGGQEWVLGKDGQELFLAPADAGPQQWHAERITQWGYIVDHCCHPEQWDECDTTKPEHIALHDPRDTIARCEAELALLDRYEAHASIWTLPSELGRGAEFVDVVEGVRTAVLNEIVTSLALARRHREGFNPDWLA